MADKVPLGLTCQGPRSFCVASFYEEPWTAGLSRLFNGATHTHLFSFFRLFGHRSIRGSENGAGVLASQARRRCKKNYPAEPLVIFPFLQCSATSTCAAWRNLPSLFSCLKWGDRGWWSLAGRTASDLITCCGHSRTLAGKANIGIALTLFFFFPCDPTTQRTRSRRNEPSNAQSDGAREEKVNFASKWSCS